MTEDLEAEAAADLALLRAAEAAEPPPWPVQRLLDSDGKPYATLYQVWVFVGPYGLWAGEGKCLAAAEFVERSRTALPAWIERWRAARLGKDTADWPDWRLPVFNDERGTGDTGGLKAVDGKVA